MEVLYYFPMNFKYLNQINLSWATSLNIMKCDICRKNRPFGIILYPPVWKATIITMHSFHCLSFFRDKLTSLSLCVTFPPAPPGIPSLPILYDDAGLISSASCFLQTVLLEFFLGWYVANKQLSSPSLWSRAKPKIRSPLGTAWLREQSCTLISMAVSPQFSRSVKSVIKTTSLSEV